MKTWLATLLLVCAATAQAQTPQHTDKQTQSDIERHRAMAAAHDAAAKCLASNKDHESCRKELQAACKNLAIGKYCGMKHAH